MKNKNPVTRADSEPLRVEAFAQAYTGGGPGPLKIKVPPRRKRAYHRALKRGEHWAVGKKTLDDAYRTLAQSMYASVLEPSPFLGLLKTIAEDKKK